MLRGMLPEDELCLLLARGQLPPDVRVRALGLLAGPIRWEGFLQRAEEHRVTPLLYRSLQELKFPGVPAEVRAEITALFRANGLRNMFLVGELARVLRLLGSAGIRVLPLKGVALAKSLYGDPAFRICSDIDILVPRGDTLAARRVLITHGYTSPFSDHFFINHQFHTSADCPLFPQRETVPYLLELHWTLLQHSSKNAEAIKDLWSQAHPQDYFGVHAFGMTPEWRFLYLAGHVASHKWQTLRWISDIHDLCMSTPINWIMVQEMSERFDFEFVAASTLAVCSSLYGTPIPTNFLPANPPTGVPLFPNSLDASEAWKAPLFYRRLLKNPSEKLRWFAEMFFVARMADRRIFNLPAYLSFLYYLLRPMRLTLKWSRLFLTAGFLRLRISRQSDGGAAGNK